VQHSVVHWAVVAAVGRVAGGLVSPRERL